MMTPVTTRLAGLLSLLGLLVLTACSRGPDAPPLQVELLRNLSDRVGARLSGGKADPAARPPLTRAGLNEIKAPYIEVTIEKKRCLCLSVRASSCAAMTAPERWRSGAPRTISA
ncbi:hypothetical protein [Phaeobacter inhibens]|uniref:hypothetical protein n=1 Tax=Phaeobacter inhibens TaxID=221822 RepID=UPI0021A958D6|nr:hypothetical protein [Phaeobacter inhibens]